EEEGDKMIEQKMKEEQRRRKKKEMDVRMSLQEPKEQEKLWALEEEKHQLFLQLKKFDVRRRNGRKEGPDRSAVSCAPQSLVAHTGAHLLGVQKSPGRPCTLLVAERTKQMFRRQVLGTRHYVGSAAAFAGSPEPGQFQGGPSSAYGTACLTMPAVRPSLQLRAPSAFPAARYLSQPQPQLHAGHFPPTQTGFLQPGGRRSLQRQMKPTVFLHPMYPQALHAPSGLSASLQLLGNRQPAVKSGFPVTRQPGSHFPFIQQSPRICGP
uniref:G protein pathway suppressor 2 n=1 Tax=Mustela putorius furo TaxID=9669 RepID=M3XP26_MUSPF